MKKWTVLLLTLALCCVYALGSAVTLDEATYGIRMELPDEVQFSAEPLNIDVSNLAQCPFAYISEAGIQAVEEYSVGKLDVDQAEEIYGRNYVELGYLYVLPDEAAEAMQMTQQLQDQIDTEGVGDKASVTEIHQNGFTYVVLDLFGFAADEELDEGVLDAAVACYAGWLEAIAQAEFYEPKPLSLSAMDGLTFTTINLDGEEVTEEIFAGKDITVVNIWATWCNPCINEMPELAKWASEMPENVQMVYLCANLASLDDATNKKIASTVAKRTGMDRKNILLCPDGVFDALMANITAYPTTIFIDSNGRLYDQNVVGANVPEYKQVVEELLKK